MVINLAKTELETTSITMEAIKNQSVKDTVLSLMQPQQSYGYVTQSTKYDIKRYKDGAVDTENLLISTPLWADNILEFDGFSTELTKKLLKYQDDNNEHFWDYNISEFLSEQGYDLDLFEHGHGDYTYNNPDYYYLDRNIHYTVFNYDGEEYVCMAIHHGADARIGFSDSMVFKITDLDYFFLSMEITAYNTETDEDISISELDEIATYNKEEKEWQTKDGNAYISIYSSADGH